MPRYIDPITSEKNLDLLVEKVFKKSFSNLHTTIMCFRGAGKPAELRYLLKNYQSIPEFRTGRYFIWLDLLVLSEDENLAYKSSITSLMTYFGDVISDLSKDLVVNLTSRSHITQSEYISFLQYLITHDNVSLTLILENFRKTYDSSINSKRTLAIVSDLSKINPPKLCFIFIADREVDDLAKANLGLFWPYFSGNFVWGNEIPFDRECIDIAFKNQSMWHQKDFTPGFKDKVSVLAYNDPTLTKHLIMQAISNQSFESDLSSTETLPALYTLIGEYWLDIRYTHIVSNLSQQSVEQLHKMSDKFGEFIINSGLVLSNDEGKYLAFSPLFEYFLSHRLNTSMQISNELKSPRDYLSGQELIVFNLLVDKRGILVSKDDIAQVIWGDTWEQKYSDWALDKLISTLRKKLNENNEKYKLKSVKGKGVLLV